MSTIGNPLPRLSVWFSSRKPSPWWLLGPTAIVTGVSAASWLSTINLLRDLLCRSHESYSDELPPGGGDCDRDSKRKLYWGGIILAVNLSIGLLSCITAAWWGSLSDRYGRTRILALGITGLLYSHLSLIVAHLIGSEKFRYIYWLAIDGAVVQGALGGMITVGAITQAYIVDTTTEANRAKTLSLYLGLSGLGALVGAIFSNAFSARLSARTPIYVLAGVHAVYAIYVWTIVPDSLTDEEKDQAQQSYKSARASERHSLKSVKQVASLFNPIALLGPTTANTSGNPLRHGGKDWSLALLVLVLGVGLSSGMGFRFRLLSGLYFRLGSGPIPVAYYQIAVEVFAFLVLFPVIKRWRTTARLNASSVSTQEGYQSVLRDFKIGRVALGILFLGHIILSLFPQSLPIVAFPGLLGVLGVIFEPALTSVVVSTYTRQGGKEIGRLLGGISVIGRISTFIANFLFTLFATSAASAIIPAAILVASYYLLRHVRVPEVDLDGADSGHDLDEEERLLSSE